jgi:tRNA-dihydrouridine synthase B
MLKEKDLMKTAPGPEAGVCAAKVNALLPWMPVHTPLMLAPMQGLTNRSMRSLFINWVRPDVVFTEFMRIKPLAQQQRLSAGDLCDAAATEGDVPLVVQLFGHGCEALVTAACAAGEAGARHLNLNMGCPYGRMTSGLTGGGMLKCPEELAKVIPALRRVVSGTFSVKLRAGYADPLQIFDLLPLFEASGVDFLVLHPRTVVQAYQGHADHRITAEVVRKTSLPVIANGDIRNAATGLRVLRESGAVGLMLGRGAIADPLLFERLRGKADPEPDRPEKAEMLRRYLSEVLTRYSELFCGEVQILGKVKDVLSTIEDPDFAKGMKQLKKARTMRSFTAALEDL